MTFLESPATLVELLMRGNRAVPLLRLVDSPFNVTGSIFTGGTGPAVSVEYSEGDFTETLVANGSGLRVSGSIVELRTCHFEEITGTAVEVEQESTLFGAGVTCTAVGTALASESGSTAAVDGLIARDTVVAVHAGKAAAGFQPGAVRLRGATCENVTTPYVENGGGTILIDGRRPAT